MNTTPRTARALSAPAVASLISRLEGETITAKQLRQLPIRVPRDRRGALQYGSADIAMARLCVRLRRLFRKHRLQAWKANAAILYLGELIRMATYDPASHALAIDVNVGAAILIGPVTSTAGKLAPPSCVVVPLSSVVPPTEGLRAAS